MTKATKAKKKVDKATPAPKKALYAEMSAYRESLKPKVKENSVPDTQEALRIALKLMTKEQTEDMYDAVQCDDLVHALTEATCAPDHPEAKRIAKALCDALDEAEEYLEDCCRFHKVGYPYDESEDE